MFLKLDSADGEWFQFFGSRITDEGDIIYEDPDPTARVKIRSMAPFFEERLKARQRVVENVLNPLTRQMEKLHSIKPLSIEESIQEKEDVYDYSIMEFDWNIRDPKTKGVIECTRENKIALMKNPIFNRFFAKSHALLENTGDQKEAEIKNS